MLHAKPFCCVAGVDFPRSYCDGDECTLTCAHPKDSTAYVIDARASMLGQALTTRSILVFACRAEDVMTLPASSHPLPFLCIVYGYAAGSRKEGFPCPFLSCVFFLATLRICAEKMTLMHFRVYARNTKRSSLLKLI